MAIESEVSLLEIESFQSHWAVHLRFSGVFEELDGKAVVVGAVMLQDVLRFGGEQSKSLKAEASAPDWEELSVIVHLLGVVNDELTDANVIATSAWEENTVDFTELLNGDIFRLVV